MRFPWANIALLLLLIIQIVSGYLGFVNGTAENRWLLWIHGVGAYAIALILIWKGAVVVEVYSRGKRWNWSRTIFAFMALLLIATLSMGLIWTFTGPIYLFGFSLLTFHIFTAVALIALSIWHLWRYRWILRIPSATGRRGFLNHLAMAMGGLFLWQLARSAKRRFEWSGATRRFTGSYETGSFTGVFPRVSWIADNPPPIMVPEWKLTVSYANGEEKTYRYEEIQSLATDELVAVLDCTGGWYSKQIWRGVPVNRLLDPIEVAEDIRSISFHSVTGYVRRFGILEATDYLLATHVNHRPLAHGHGYPLRLVAPDQRGVNWVKWINRISLHQSPEWWQSPLPLQ